MNPYQTPRTEPLIQPKTYTKEELKAHVLNNPDSGPLAKFLVRHPKTFATCFVLFMIAVTAVIFSVVHYVSITF